jgi:6-phosphogluconate dehydrogenase
MKEYRDKLKDALLAGILCSYAQGIELIKKASNDNGWHISLSETVSLWRAGCIIRSPILEEIREALTEDAQNILLTEKLSYIADLETSWREVAIQAQQAALPVPTLISTLLYYDCLNAEKLSTNLVQAMRDCFGAHTYERIDMEGTFHTIWE